MTLSKFIKRYLIGMGLAITLMLLSFFQFGLILIALTFLISAVTYFYVKCIGCGQSFGVFGELISFKSFATDKCSKCLKADKQNQKNR